MKPTFSAALIAGTAMLFACSDDDKNNNAEPQAEPAFSLQLLHFADVDGGRDIVTNAPKFSALVEKFKAEYDNTLFVSSGDNWIPGPEYEMGADESLKETLGLPGVGRAHVAYLNAMALDASALGNHEFDLGTEAIASIISPETSEDDETMQWVGAEFPYLATNLDIVDDEALLGIANTGQLAHSVIRRYGDEKVGIIAAITPTLASISSPGDVKVLPGTNVLNEELAEEIQQSVNALKSEGIDKIILLSHMQLISIEKALASLLTDVDVIVAGGSNTILADENDVLRAGDQAVDTYPLIIQSPTNEPVLVVNVDGDFTYLGRAVIPFDENGVVLTDRLNSAVNGAYASDDETLVKLGLNGMDANADVTAISEALNSALENRLGSVFGRTEVYLNGERSSVRVEETNLGNLTADANLAYAQSIDSEVVVSIKNAGGIRSSIGQCELPPGSVDASEIECLAPKGVQGINNVGDISQLAIESTLRFNNGLTVLSLTAEQLKDVMEHGVSQANEVAGRFPQIGGFSMKVDKSLDVGQRILAITLDSGEVIVENGEIVESAKEKTYRAVTLGYIATGGDGYPFPSDNAANVLDLKVDGAQNGEAIFADDGTEQDALAEYLLANYPADNDEATPVYNRSDDEVDTRIVFEDSAE